MGHGRAQGPRHEAHCRRAGNDATNPKFDATEVEQWGFDMQYADNSPLAETSLFGASSFLASDGKTAQIPEQLSTGEKWYNDGVWKDHFIPSAEPDHQRPAGQGQ